MAQDPFLVYTPVTISYTMTGKSSSRYLDRIPLGSIGLILGISLSLEQGLVGENWQGYRGPQGNGISAEHILQDWPASGLRVLWRTPATGGFSSMSIHEDQAFTQVKRTINAVAREVCVAFSTVDGRELWATAVDSSKYDSGGDTGTSTNKGGDGPRSTPVFFGGKVYVLSSYLHLYCLNAANGQVVWDKDLPKLYGGQVIAWQSAASPLVEGEMVFVNGNGTGKCLLAFKADTGALVWGGQSDRMTHATPVAATIGNVRQVIFFAQSGLVSVVPETGKVLWRYAFPYQTSTAASPVVAGDIVYCSAGYNIGAAAIRVTKPGTTLQVEELWQKPGEELQNHWTTPVHHDGYLYAIHGHGEFGYAPLKCIDLMTGEERWSKSGFGPGGLLLVDGKLLVLSDDGELVQVQPDPSAYRETKRFQAINGKCWNAPSLSNGRIYLRSTKEAVSLDARLPAPPDVRFQPSVRIESGQLQLSMENANGTPMDAEVSGRIELYESENLLLPLTDWVKVSEPAVLTNGVLRVTVPFNPSVEKKFYQSVQRTEGSP